MELVPKIVRAAKNLRIPITNVLRRSLSSKGPDDLRTHCTCYSCCYYSCPPGDPCANLYDTRKYSPNLPKCSRQQCLFEVLQGIPTDIFRCTDGECLGPQGQASKCCMYPNPEYFAYHNMTFFDLHLILRPFRQTCANSNRKPN